MNLGLLPKTKAFGIWNLEFESLNLGLGICDQNVTIYPPNKNSCDRLIQNVATALAKVFACSNSC